MDHAALSTQVRSNLHYLAGAKGLLHAGTSVPFAPAEEITDLRFADSGGGVLDDYAWAAVCHRDDFTTPPACGDTVTFDSQSFDIARLGKVRETGEVILYFSNPAA